MDLLCPTIVRNCLFLAYTEQLTVRELDVAAIRRHAAKMRLYYGTTDAWCPLEFYERLKAKVPELNAVVDKWGFEHAFVLNSSKEMGVIVAEWFKQDCDK